MKYRYVNVNGLEVFYRECGDADKPVMVLFHGFPSAGHMFRDLMPLLENHFHLIAPDYPGFGCSESPDRNVFPCTFDHLAEVMDAFLQELDVNRFYMYVFDYGAPIGFRIAMKRPDAVLGIVSQNGNVYEEGLGKKWEARAEYWKNPKPELREQYKSAFAKDTVIGQYTYGTPEGSVSPDGWTLDLHYVQTIPDYAEKQSDLIFDYQNNVALYPAFQDYLRTYRPPLLAVWGKNDPSFIPEGAKAFLKDVPEADVRFVDSGHFALESHCKEIASHIINFFF